MFAVQSHCGRIKVGLWVLSHDHEIKSIRFRRGDKFGERAGAVSAKKRVNVNHAFVIDQLIFPLRSSLGSQLVDCSIEPTQTMAAVDKGKL